MKMSLSWLPALSGLNFWQSQASRARIRPWMAKVAMTGVRSPVAPSDSWALRGSVGGARGDAQSVPQRSAVERVAGTIDDPRVGDTACRVNHDHCRLAHQREHPPAH